MTPHTTAGPIAAFVCALVFSTPTAAQIRPPAASDGSGLTLRLEHVNLRGGTGPQFPSGLMQIGLARSVTDNILLVLTAPVSFVTQDIGLALGNVESRAIVEISPESRLELGLRMGWTATGFGDDNPATALGVKAALDQSEAWANQLVASISAGFTRSKPLQSRGRAEATVTLLAASYGREGAELVSRVAGRGVVPFGRADVGAGLSVSHLTLGDRGIGARFAAYLDLTADLTARSGMPGVFVRLPISREARNLLRYSIGLHWRN